MAKTQAELDAIKSQYAAVNAALATLTATELEYVTGAKSSGYKSYTIKAGDTLYSIAAQHKTTVAALAKLNRIANPDRILVGEVILVP